MRKNFIKWIPFACLMALTFSACGLNSDAVEKAAEKTLKLAESEESSDGGQIANDVIADAVSRDEYVKSTEEYAFRDLLRYNTEYAGRKVQKELEIKSISDGQILGADADGFNYFIIDGRKSDQTRLLNGDRIRVYGEFQGTTMVSGTELPQIEAKYVDIEDDTKTAVAETETTQTQAAETKGYGSSSTDQKYETMYVVNCRESITLRTAPNTKAAGIRQIPLGAVVSYIETAENGFYKVTYLSDTGYALASYLATEPSSYRTPAPAAPAPSYRSTYSYGTTLYVVNCRESITLRTSPSTSAGEICQIPLGQAVTYMEDASNGFLKIVYNGRTGYSLASYLGTVRTGAAPSYHSTYSYGTTLYVVNCRESITLRPSPSTSSGEICQIPLGQAVTYVEDASNGFLKIVYNGRTGYSLASYLSR